MYSYAVEVLEKEKQLLKKCLSEWDVKQYPEARKEREDRLKSINKAINHLRN